MADEQIVQTDTTPTEPPAPTWDNVTATPPATPDPPPTPLETTEATPPPLEPAAQATPEPAPAREGENEPTPTPTDEYTAEADDPAEIAALPTPAAKRWAKRQFKEAEISRRYLSTEPIKEFGDDLYQRSPSRYWEFVDDLTDTHADDISQRLFGMSAAEVRTKLQSQTPAPSAPSTTTTPTAPTALTETELATLTDAQIVERHNAALKSAQEEVEARLRTEFDQKFNELKTQFDDVSGKFKTHENTARENQVIALESELKTNVLKVVQDGIRESGLEPKADDPPKIASLKQAALKLINTQFEPTFDADEDNVKVVDRVREFARRLERANVFREEDNLKVRARSAFEKVKQTPEVKAILDEISAFVEQSKVKPKTIDPAPPVAGAAGGITIAPPTTWDEAISQARSA